MLTLKVSLYCYGLSQISILLFDGWSKKEVPFEGHKILKMFFLFKLYIIVIINNAINSLTKCKVKN